jgi:GntR family transcriptional repressor for pyruvate dehydrogenase complex
MGSKDGRPRFPRSSEVLAGQIVRDLASGKLGHTGEPVTEQGLMREYGASRAALREALRILAVQGMVDARPGVGGGIIFQSPTPAGLATSLAIYLSWAGHTLGDVLEARINLEPLVARLAAARATGEDRARIVAALRAMEGAAARMTATGYTNKEELIRSHHDFHHSIALAAHNAVFEVFQQSIASINDQHTYAVHYDAPRVAYLLDLHCQIAQAIDAHDEDRAAALIQQDATGFLSWLSTHYPYLIRQPVRWLVSPNHVL